MYLNILKKDLKRKKAMNIILLVFMILATMFVSSSVNNIISVTTALDNYFEMANVPDYVAATMKKAVAANLDGTLKNAESIDSFQSEEIIYSATAYYAIKYIELSGYWSVTEEIDNPSRIMFTVNRDDLYRIQLSDPAMDTFLKAIMRIYPALFSHLAKNSEEFQTI